MITNIKFHQTEKLHVSSFSGEYNLTDHITAFNSHGRAHFNDEEKDTEYWQMFVENLNGHALTWFSRLTIDFIDSLCDLFYTVLEPLHKVYSEKSVSIKSLEDVSRS